MAVGRLLSALLLVVGISVGLVGPAAADPYGPATGSASVSRTEVKQGQVVNVRGDGFCPGSTATVTVTADGDRYIRKEIIANRKGIASTRLSLTRLGQNVIELEGCRQGGGRQVLSATVRVKPWPGRAHAEGRTVSKGEKITVGGAGFCRKAPVVVTVLDDGKRYKRTTVRSNRAGEVQASVRLTRAGRTTIVMKGCRDEGWTQKLRTTVRVTKAGSASMSPTSVVRQAAANTPGGAPTVGVAALLVAFLAGQLVFARRRATFRR
jgi:hypothetical protein